VQKLDELEAELACLEAAAGDAAPERSARRAAGIEDLRRRISRVREHEARMREVTDAVRRHADRFARVPTEKDVRAIGGRAGYVAFDEESGRWVRTYGSYEAAATAFTKAMLRVWREGDQHGHLFRFPKCDFHVDAATFTDPAQAELLDIACQMASENGTPYFIFDRNAVILSACCRLRTKVQDEYMLEHPESLRFCGFQNVTINLPQCAYRAGRGNFAGLIAEIEKMMDLAMKAHVQKRQFIAKLMSAPELPLWQVGKIAADGRPYIDLKSVTHIIGLIGLNECVAHLAGRELHESEEVLLTGLRIVAHMYCKAKELGARYGLRVSLEESPAESAARRLAKTDLQRFPQAASFVRGDPKTRDVYYTNSIHLRADAPVDLATRLRMQAKFHTLIESGAIVHAFVGEHRPSPAAVKSLVRLAWEKTQVAQITISPEFTLCGSCHRMIPGLKSECPHCGGRDIEGRYVGEVEVRPGDLELEALEKLLQRSGA
jgi:ribonucleoside-triphosphate reductase